MKRDVLHGVAWTGGALFLVRATRYIALFILAGLISPKEFGVFTAFFIIIDGLLIFQSFGIGQALVYRKVKINIAADTAFYLSLALSILFFIVAWVLGPAVETFYDASEMIEPYRACSFLLILSTLRMIPLRLFEKELDFKKKLWPTLAGAISYLVFAPYLAYKGLGVWSLVVGELAAASTETVFYWFISSWRPKLRFDLSIARADMRFGLAILGGTFLIFLFRNIDRITISRLIDMNSLGYYVFAYTIASLPATLPVRALNTVLFPSYSSLGDNREQQRILFLRAISYVAAFSLLFAIGAVAFGRYFLEAAYGDRWLPAVMPLYILVFFGLFRSLAAMVGDLLIGTGKPGLFRKIYALQLSVAIVGLYWGIHWWGVSGVAVVMTLAAIASFIAGYRAASKILNFQMRDYLGALFGPSMASAVAISLSIALLKLLPEKESLWVVVATAFIVTAVFAAVWYSVDSTFRAECTRWRRKSRGSGISCGKRGES